jgi:hypothetical protein
MAGRDLQLEKAIEVVLDKIKKIRRPSRLFRRTRRSRGANA